ncbi:peroxidase [Lithospermum erythrorhizon]|uniref:Peroxidase n=1 Tax=Lithospermum erythrorhizon TaxID=34254 RepID=A0AAV3RRK0_LITER
MSPMSLLLLLMVLINSLASCNAQLSPTFYSQTCSNATTTIRTIIRRAISAERRMAASLIRLHFHDCFVQGCDASVLLDDAPGIDSEKNSQANANSARGFNVIEDAKRSVESFCPGIVSCADILAQAAMDSSAMVGGPSWTVKYGRRDSTTASRTLANTNLPGAFSTLPTLISSFAAQGLNQREMVVLSGAHTLGQARCLLFRARIYNATNIDAGFASTRRRQCPVTGGNANLAPLDLVTPNSFDNNYFKNLIQLKGLLPSDQVLFNGGSADSVVTAFSNSPSTFASEFAAAMIKMGDISPLTGQNGIIRRVCNAIN